jgi:serine/threonine protein kinase
MILTAGKEYHYVAIGINTESFKLMYGFRHLVINLENGKISQSKTQSHNFYLDEHGYLKHSMYYVYYNKYSTYLELFVSANAVLFEEDKVKCQVEIFDFKPIQYSGTYAAVYCPSLSGRTDLVTRLCMDKTTDIIPTHKKEIFSSFCLFPLEKTDLGDMTIAEYTKCTNYHEMKEYTKQITFLTAIKSFRNLWTGLKIFEEHKFFHSDIKLQNIVFDDGIAKFIDFDLSFFLDGHINSNNLFEDVTLCCIFPTVPNAIALTYYSYMNGLHGEMMSDHCSRERDEYISYYTTKFQYYGLDKLLCNNISSIHECEDTYRHLLSKYTTVDSLEASFYYISIYQLAIAFFDLIKQFDTKKYRHVICHFLLFCLDFGNYGMVKIDEVIQLYDQLSDFIEKSTSKEMSDLETMSGDKTA